MVLKMPLHALGTLHACLLKHQKHAAATIYLVLPLIMQVNIDASHGISERGKLGLALFKSNLHLVKSRKSNNGSSQGSSSELCSGTNKWHAQYAQTVLRQKCITQQCKLQAG